MPPTADAAVRRRGGSTAGRGLPKAAFEDAAAEHILLEGDGRIEEAASTPLTPRRQLALRDGLHGRQTRLELYAEGFLDVEQQWRGGKRRSSHRLDLRYLDPVPEIERRRPIRCLKAALVLAGAAAVAAVLGSVEVLGAYPMWAAVAAGAAAAAALAIYARRSCEIATFLTLHGRAPALRLTAGLGAIRRCRSLLPELSAAIEEAAEDIGADTRQFLRGEMREHYRLRSDGVLTPEVCTESTGRILAQFDIDL
jgi:hypothetical protein